MRFGISQWLALGLALAYVAGTIFLHSWSCRYRLHRACRLYGAGQVREADRVTAAVSRSVEAHRRRHPMWGMSIAGEASR